MASYHFSVKSGKRGTAVEHARYISREGKYSTEERAQDLVFKDHGNLPSWANGNPIEFWKTADEKERTNGAVYREYEVALPSELTNEQNLDLVKELIKDEVGDKSFQFAIHCPNAALGGVLQPHLHLMFSDRKPDGISRGAEQHFKRFNRKHPEDGGCRKDSGGKDRFVLAEELSSIRESVAQIQNKHLEKHGHQASVDHRSNHERGIDQEPERHLGRSTIKKLKDSESKDDHLA